MAEISEPLNIEEKKKQILQTACEEFAVMGYAAASTNTIIQKAGISKGLLFHYFTNKQQLYLAVLDLCMEQVVAGLKQELGYLSRDVLDRIIEFNMLKIKLAAEYPLSQRLLTEAFVKPPQGLEEEMARRQQEIYTKYMPLLLEGLDRSLFKEGINVDKAVQMVVAFVNAVGEKYIQEYREKDGEIKALLNAFIEELRVYLEMIKYGIYK